MSCRSDLKPCTLLPVSVPSSPSPLAFSCRLMPVVCLCTEVMLELALLSAVTHLQLRQRNSSRQLGALERAQSPLSLKCLCGESAGCLSDLSASWARWRWADCVAACCYSTHFISSFSLWFLFLSCEDGKSLASRLKRHWQEKEKRERDSVWVCLCESTTSTSEKRVFSARTLVCMQICWRVVKGVNVTKCFLRIFSYTF